MTSWLVIALLCMCGKLCRGGDSDYDSPFQSSITIPIGTLLPAESRDADALLKLALQRHNAFPATLASQWGRGQPSLRYQVFLQNAPVNNSYRMAQEFCTHVSHRVQSMIGAWDESSSSALISYTDTFQIPWITPSFLMEDTNSDFVVSLHPRLEKFLLCFITTLRLRKITYVYDTREVHLPLKTLLRFGMKYNFQVTVRNIDKRKNVLPILKEIACNAETHLIFDVNLDSSRTILQQIASMGMLTVEYLYIFLDWGLINDNLAVYAGGSAKLYFLSFTDQTNSRIQEVKRELRKTKEGREIKVTDEAALVYDSFTAMAIGMTSISERNYVFVEQLREEGNREDEITCHQLPVVPLTTGFDITRAIKKVQFTGLTGNVQFDEKGNRINYGVNLYTAGSTGPRLVGSWTDDRDDEFGKLVINGTVSHAKILESFRNRTLIVTTILEEPYVTLKSNWETLEGNDRFEGYCVDLLKEITKIAPLQYRIKPVNDGQYGSKNEKHGTWNGMIGEVKYQKAHMAVAPLTITSAREAVVDFTKPFMSLGISIMIKKPEKQTPNIFSFLEPLSYEIWICIGFAYTGVSVVLYLVSRLSPYEWHKGALSNNVDQGEEADSVTDFGIMNSLWFSLGAFVQQGCDISPKSFSGRIVGGVWWFFTLIIISSYTANLAAFLTVDRMVSPISGAEDLAKQNVIKYGTLKSGSTVNFFKQSPLPTYEKMWGFMKSQDPSVFVGSNREGIEKVRSSNGKYAFLMESTLNDYMEQRKPCNTMKVGPNIDAKGYGIALPKGSPLYDTVNLAILTLREQGQLQKMKNYWWYDKSECGPNGNNSPTKTPALMLSNVAGVFYILIVGMILAVFISIIEYGYEAVKADHRKRKKLVDDKTSTNRTCTSGLTLNVVSSNNNPHPVEIPRSIFSPPPSDATRSRRNHHSADI
uniref:Glutamate receptor 1-like n=1 Tax=Phallusia mammillata TaxID=59560 RepID=A0A6F9DEK7_9ASCI|nr:glutamate receptor 1-like [Phallusia mammillata]